MPKPIVTDMNLSPRWGPYLANFGYSAKHWSIIGRPDEPDDAIFLWAAANDHILMTNDLDFSRLLAISKATAPSLIQIRTEILRVSVIGLRIVNVLNRYQPELDQGSLIGVDEVGERVRLLPI